MPPSMKLSGSPILVDLNALLGRPSLGGSSREIIRLDQMKAVPKDAITVEEIDPLTVLIAGTRRKGRR